MLRNGLSFKELAIAKWYIIFCEQMIRSSPGAKKKAQEKKLNSREALSPPNLTKPNH